MQKNFVFRNREGRLCGCLVQREEEISCRLYDSADNARLTIALQDGSIRRYDIAGGGRESTWKHEGKPVCAAYVESGGALLMDTGETARKLYRDTAFRKKRNSTERETETKAAGNQEQTKEKKSFDCGSASPPAALLETADAGTQLQNSADTKEMRIYPHRRWPPPVLMLAPVYSSGRWMDEAEAESGKGC